MVLGPTKAKFFKKYFFYLFQENLDKVPPISAAKQ